MSSGEMARIVLKPLPGRPLARTVWVVSVVLSPLSRFAGAVEPALTIDLDGDGLRDHVVLDRREPAGLRVWLSASDTTEVIRTRVPLLQVVAADLDGDHQ